MRDEARERASARERAESGREVERERERARFANHTNSVTFIAKSMWTFVRNAHEVMQRLERKMHETKNRFCQTKMGKNNSATTVETAKIREREILYNVHRGSE